MGNTDTEEDNRITRLTNSELISFIINQTALILALEKHVKGFRLAEARTYAAAVSLRDEAKREALARMNVRP